tara:strand:- start:654 stop:1319 length:666 start_codon:yes stop_codon:yes gene_type:complete
MKLFLNSFFLLILLLCGRVYSEDFYKEFVVKVSGIKIGKLSWSVKIDETNYSNQLKLKSEGLLSGLYRFNGEYSSEGKVINKKLKPLKYNHLWKTKKIEKNMRLVFENNKLNSLYQKPNETERLRVNVYNVEESKDPLTSFLQIVLGETSSLVVDGRRIYTMNSFLDKKSYETTIEISNYANLWADHKRNKFEKITFEKEGKLFFPKKINIYFDGKVFKLE